MSRTHRREMHDIINDDYADTLFSKLALDQAYQEQRRREDILWQRRKAAAERPDGSITNV